MKTRKTEAFRVLRKMPELSHTKKEYEYDVRKSEILQWMIKQPEILNFLWNKVKQSGDIEYVRGIGKWRGIDYDD